MKATFMPKRGNMPRTTFTGHTHMFHASFYDATAKAKLENHARSAHNGTPSDSCPACAEIKQQIVEENKLK